MNGFPVDGCRGRHTCTLPVLRQHWAVWEDAIPGLLHRAASAVCLSRVSADSEEGDGGRGGMEDGEIWLTSAEPL